MFKKVDYIIVYVSDMKRSLRFYRDTLGFRVRFDSEFWTELDTGETTLALHGGAERSDPAERGQEAERGHGDKHAGTVGIGLSVSNLDATFRMLEGQGVPFVIRPTLREREGIRLAVVLDPDGLQISLSEPVAGAEARDVR